MFPDEEEDWQREDHERNMDQLRHFFPNGKVKITGIKGVFNLDVISNRDDIECLIKNNKIYCYWCERRVRPNSFVYVVSPPKKKADKVRVLIFCGEDDMACHSSWELWGDEDID